MQSNIINRLLWHLTNPFVPTSSFNNGNPAPLWFIPLDNWTSNRDEMIRLIRMDDILGIGAVEALPSGTSLEGQNVPMPSHLEENKD